MWTLAHLSDLHVLPQGELAYGRVDTNAAARAAVEALHRLDPPPDLVVITGDLTHHGTPEEVEVLAGILAGLPCPARLVPGNHDRREPLRARLPEAFPETSARLAFTTGLGRWQVIGLDTLVVGSDAGEAGEEQLAWLHQTLIQTADRPTLLVLHHPPFATGIGWMDRTALADADGLAELLRKHPQVRAVLAGHVHRAIVGSCAGRPALIAPAPGYAVALGFGPGAAEAFTLEPGGFMVHRLGPSGEIASHVVPVEAPPGPFPFAAAP